MATLEERAEREHQVARPDVPAVDLCSKENSQICQRIRDQSSLRDEVAKTSNPVYLNCADGKSVDCGAVSPDGWFTFATRKQLRISEELSAAMHGGKFETKLGSGDGLASLYKFLQGGSSPTSRAPMRADRKLYWELASRPYEKPLVDALSQGDGPITHGSMMETALRVTGNDRKLAILTLANFTKNMAAIERRQMSPEQISPELRSTYTKQTIDSIFNRIEGFADDPTEKYNKEGAIYHMYSAMFAATQIGPVASFGTSAYNMGRLVGDRSSSDAIKSAAGNLGAQFWWGMTPAEFYQVQDYAIPF